jgi:biotin operon repressor
MVDLLPWVRQWHNEDGESADAFEAYVTEQARRLEVSLDEVRAYRRPARVAARAGAGAARKAASPASSEQLTLDAPRARPQSAAPGDSALTAAVEAVRSLDQGPGVALAELGERLGLSSAALKKTLDTLVEAGRLVERKKRPRLVSCNADDAAAQEGAGA